MLVLLWPPVTGTALGSVTQERSCYSQKPSVPQVDNCKCRRSPWSVILKVESRDG